MTEAQIYRIAAEAGIAKSRVSPAHRRLIAAAIESTKPKEKKVKASIRKTPNFEYFGVTE